MDSLENKKLKILVCAFACVRDPDTRFGFGLGGESGLGWNVLVQASNYSEVFVLTEGGNRETIEKKLAQASFPNLHFYYINLPSFLHITKKWIQVYTYLWQIKAYLVARKLHAKIHFDLFCHVTYANDWMASFIGALLPMPYVRGPGGGAHQIPKSFVKDYPFKQKLAQRVRSLGQWAFRHDPFFIMGQNRAKALLVCNQESFDALPLRWQTKARLFPVNGISKEDLTLFNQKTTTTHEGFTIFTAGKLLKIKGIDLGLRAFKKLIDSGCQASYVIVGDGPELESLKELARTLDLEKRVVFESWASRETVLQKMIASDVFLFPSLRDGGGNVVVEAMAAGRPVVCFDIAGPGFHIQKYWGIKVPANNPEQAVGDLAQALETLYHNKGLREKLGKAAKQRVEEFYLWDKLGATLKEIYYESAVKP